ncbi:hypothetical protein D3C73_1175610 [compost metagenome]
MIKHLIHRAMLSAGNLEQLAHVLRVQVGDAPASDFSCRYQRLQAFDRFFQGNLAAPVQQIQIKMVSPQTFQAIL